MHCTQDIRFLLSFPCMQLREIFTSSPRKMLLKIYPENWSLVFIVKLIPHGYVSFTWATIDVFRLSFLYVIL